MKERNFEKYRCEKSDFQEDFASEISELANLGPEKLGVSPAELENTLELALDFADIIEETELPEKFEVCKTTSKVNTAVKEKMDYILKAEGLNLDEIIPESLRRDYPRLFTKEYMKKASYANTVHACMAVLNSLNTISGIQREKEDLTDKDERKYLLGCVVDVAYDLQKRSVFANEFDNRKRNGEDLKLFSQYRETKRRGWGEEGVNPERKVSLEEMKHILNVVKESYRK